MSVKFTHPLYHKFESKWKRCEDAVAGSDDIKDCGGEYLPKLSGQTDDEYDGYKARALWYGATARTIQGLAGAIMRKPPVVTVPDGMVEDLKDITLSGTSLENLIASLTTETLKTGRNGLLVEMSNMGGTNARPYWVMYTADQIVNWKTARVNGEEKLILVVLKEYSAVEGEDEFEVKVQCVYRVLSLDAAGYHVRIFTPRPNSDAFDIEDITPVKRGTPLKEIPFCFIGSVNNDPTPAKPPLLDLVDVNLSHYKSSADLEHGRHFCGLPTPWAVGFDPKTTKLEIGSSRCWISKDANAKVGMLEFTGQGLGALVTALEEKAAEMAVLGARMLEAQKSSVEATQTHKIRLSGEQSALQSVAGSIGHATTKCLRWHALWKGIQAVEDIRAELNKDYAANGMTSEELSALTAALQAGSISYETFYYNLQRGELTRPDVTAEEEKELIDTQNPNMDAPTNMDAPVNEDENVPA